jgi:hypothetical protein
MSKPSRGLKKDVGEQKKRAEQIDTEECVY